MSNNFTSRELRILKSNLVMARSRAYEHSVGINLLYEDNLKPETEQTYSSYIAELNTLIHKIEDSEKE